jgi:hypothetical protein
MVKFCLEALGVHAPQLTAPIALQKNLFDASLEDGFRRRQQQSA